jgi:ADP-ribosylation factor-like protein 2
MNDCLLELQNLLQEERLSGASLLILANKQDLKGALSVQQIKDYLNLDSISSHHWAIFPVSAMTGENINEGMNWIIKDIGDTLYLIE